MVWLAEQRQWAGSTLTDTSNGGDALSPTKKLAGCFRKGGVGFCAVKTTISLWKRRGNVCWGTEGEGGSNSTQRKYLIHEVSAKRSNCGYSQLPTGSLPCLVPFEVIYYSPFHSFHPRHIGFLVFLDHMRYIPPQDISTCCSNFWNSIPSTSAWLFPYLLQVFVQISSSKGCLPWSPIPSSPPHLLCLIYLCTLDIITISHYVFICIIYVFLHGNKNSMRAEVW